jgi:phosphoketolase
MPAELQKAHTELDKAVEKAYGKLFSNDSERVAFLFERYKDLTKDLFTEKLGKKRREKTIK